MKSGNALTFFQALDGLDAHLDTFLGLFAFFDPLQAFNNVIGHVHARNTFLHILGHAHRLHGGQAGQNVTLFMQAPVTNAFHPLFEFIQVVNTLRLDEFDPGGNFFRQARDPDFKRIGKRVGRRAHKHLGLAVKIVAAQKLALVAHVPHGLDQLDRVDIVNILALSTITETLVVSGQTQNVVDFKRSRTQNIALQGDAIAIACDHL